ncbi:MAG: hypothetical protein ACQETI_12480 [Halobacteriota archaeon]
MTNPTRRSVLGLVGGLVTAGCLADPNTSSATDTPEPSASPPGTSRRSETPTEPSQNETTTLPGDWIARASKRPNPDHGIYLANDATESVRIHVWVVRDETGATVFEETKTVSEGAEIEAYNLNEADPAGVESFTVRAELVHVASSTPESPTTAQATSTTTSPTTAEPQTETKSDPESVTIETNECFGNVHVTVQGDGSLSVFYAIC